MKKYIHPTTKVIRIQSSQLLADSDPQTDDTIGDLSWNSKEFTDFDDDEEDGINWKW